MPVVMVAVMLGMVGLMLLGSTNPNPSMLIFPVFMVLSMLMMFAPTSSEDPDEIRRVYLRHLGVLGEQARAVAVAQKEYEEFCHPAPHSLWSLVDSPRLWERVRGDADVLTVRVGTGVTPLATPIVIPEMGAQEDLDPVCLIAFRHTVQASRAVHGVPLTVDLTAFPFIGIVEGDEGEDSAPGGDSVRDLARAIIASAAFFHGPELLGIDVCGRCATEWESVKWLPHNRDPYSAPWTILVVDDVPGEQQAASADPNVLETRIAAAAGTVICIVVGSNSSTELGQMCWQDGLVLYSHGDPQEGECASAGASAHAPRNRGDRSFSPRVGQRTSRERVWSAGAGEPSATHGRSRTRNTQLGVATEGGEQVIGLADGVTEAEFDQLVRAIGAYDRPGSGYEAIASSGELLPMLGVSTPTRLPLGQLWERDEHYLLAVPIGADEEGRPVVLDMKESALGGVGPHGLCIGATGSGKSELLKTLVVSLALTHSPADLNLILVDFKGGATFLELGKLPHTSAVITNLAEEQTLVGRMQEAISGEMNRRQEVLRAAGNIPNIGAYAQKAAHDPSLPPLPHLVIIIDEFSELLGQHPDFAELFVAVGRLGRSLGVHLLLASQRLEEGRLRGLDSHLSYRIGLKTFSASESRQVIGTADAYHLPAKPGSGYMKTDADELIRFTASYVSGPVKEATVASDEEVRVQLFTGWREADPGGSDTAAEQNQAGTDAGACGNSADEADGGSATGSPATGGPAGGGSAAGGTAGNEAVQASDTAAVPPETLVDRVVAACSAEAEAQELVAHQVWLPPLPPVVPLGAVLGGGTAAVGGTAAAGGTSGATGSSAGHSSPSASTEKRGGLAATIGIIDRPYEQRQDPFVLPLNGAAGHLAICGGPQSGKTTAVRSLVLSCATTHTTADIAFYILDLGGADLAELSSLPHVAGVVGKQNKETVDRVFAEVTQLIDDATTSGGIGSPTPTRETFLIIDGFHIIRADFEEHLDTVARIASDGLGAGVHLIITTHRWSELRPAIRDLIGGRIELHLADPLDSLIDRKAQERVPALPGRGLTPDGESMLIALSSGEDIHHVHELAAGQPPVPQLRLMPTTLTSSELPGPEGAPGGHITIPLGIGGARLAPAMWQPGVSQHLLALGARGCGKTSLMELVGQSLSCIGRDVARLIVLDPRRSLLGTFPQDMLAGYAATADTMATLVENLAVTLSTRMPSAEVSPQELRERSWWSGPDLFLLVDDCHLIADHIFQPLHPYLPHARDVGLHIVLSRKAGAFSRALYTPLISGIMDAQPDILIYSADPADGPIAGVKTTVAAPGRAQLVRESARVGPIQVALPHAETTH